MKRIDKLDYLLRESFLPLLFLLAAIVVMTLLLDQRAERLTKQYTVVHLAPSMDSFASDKLQPEEQRVLDNSEFSQHFSRGLDFQRKGNLGKARSEYKQAIKLRSGHFESNYNLGLLEIESGNYKTAQKRLEAAVSLTAGDSKAKAIFALGLAFARNGENKKAINAYRRSIEYRPDYLLPRYNLAKLFVDIGSPDAIVKAKRIIAQILSLQETFAPAHFLLGRISSRQGHPEEALKSYEKAALHDPTFWQARKNAGVVATHLGRFDLAEKIFERLAADFSNRPDGEFNLGIVAYKRGLYKKALRHYRKAIEIADGKYKQAKINMGLTLRALGRYSEALTIFDGIAANDPENAAVEVNRGLVLEQLGRFDLAVDAFQTAIKARPGYAAAHYNLGKLETKLRHFDLAVKAYRKTLEIDQAHLKAAMNLGIVLSKTGDLQGALSAYRNATLISKNYAPAYFNLGVVYKKMGKLEEAITAYRHAIELDDEHIGARLNMGVVLALQEKLELAVQMFNDVLDLDPSNVKARYNLALQYVKLGLSDKAEREFERVLEINGKHLPAMRSLANLLRARGMQSKAKELYEKAEQIEKTTMQKKASK